MSEDSNDTALLSTVRAKCAQGTRRANHGVRLEIEVVPRGSGHGDATAAVSPLRNVALDVCGDVYSALPPGAESLANLALPLSCASQGWMLLRNRNATRRARAPANQSSKPNKGWRTGDDDGARAGSSTGCCTLQIELAQNVSRPTALRCLRSLATVGGDPPFLIDVLADANVGVGPGACGRQQLVARIATKASCVLRSFAPEVADRRAHDICLPACAVPATLQRAAARRRTPSTLRRAAALIRWWLLPSLFVMFAVSLAVSHLAVLSRGTSGNGTSVGMAAAGSSRPALTNAISTAGEARAVPEWVRSHLPGWARVVRFDSGHALKTLDAALPQLPRTRSAAFRMGFLCAQQEAALAIRAAAAARGPKEKILHAFPAHDAMDDGTAVGAGRGDISSAALPTLDVNCTGGMSAVLTQLEEEEAHRGVASRVLAFFTLVNLMWLISIVGIAISLGPTLFVVLRPVYETLRVVARTLLRRVVVPLARSLHQWCVIESAAWLLATGIVHDGHRYYAGPSGMHIAVTGLAAAALALAYSTTMHGGTVVRYDPRRAKNWCVAWAGLAAAPLAVVYNSALLGTVTIYAGYYLLGFSAFCTGCCWCFGFDSRSSLARSAVASAVTVAAVIAARGAASSRPWLGRLLAPFRAPCSLCGAFVLMLALLILTLVARFESRAKRTARSAAHRGGRGARDTSRARDPLHTPTKASANAMFVCAYATLKYYGHVLELPGMSNTADVFLVFWLMSHYAVLHLCDFEWNGWVLMLIASATAWRVALWMHTHPEFMIGAMFVQAA